MPDHEQLAVVGVDGDSREIVGPDERPRDALLGDVAEIAERRALPDVGADPGGRGAVQMRRAVGGAPRWMAPGRELLVVDPPGVGVEERDDEVAVWQHLRI